MKILELRAENFKRLKAVEIKPTGAVVEITGRNGAGKSSVLDAIWAALGGKDAAPPVPVRRGEEEARISLDLGELKVIRKFHAKEGAFTTSLVVESAEGARFPSPQGVLDALVGALTFDPLDFARMPAKDQFALCRRFVPEVDFEKIESLNRGDFERRRDINRDAERAKAEAAAVRVVLPDGVSLPSERIDEEPVRARLAAAASVGQRIEARRQAVERLARLRTQIAAMEQDAAAEAARLEAEGEIQPVDEAALRQELARIEAGNEALRHAGRRKELEEGAERLKAQSDELTTAMKKRTEDAALAVAAAKMPVDGLSFGEGVVLLDGLPLEQASDAQRLRASIAIAAAMNPRLSIIRVRDGSLLDGESWRILEVFAAERDCQIWVETVASGRTHAVVIEDGGVIQAPEEVGDSAEVL